MDEPTLSFRLDSGYPAEPAPKTWGPFKLLEKVGQGAFGEVYRAFDTTLEREVALKLLLPRGLDPERESKALLREARAIARVRHNNVVPVYGVDRHEGRVGFWSDFVRGKTLSALLASQGPFAPVEAAHIGVDLCRAVAAVHAAGLLHRDIKTGNAMREEGGRILLMDFGLTQDHGEHDVMSGTPAYMAPELLSGKPATVASDIYALGVVLFHLLTGKFPVEPTRLDEMRQAHESATRKAVLDLRPDLPEALARVVETAAHPDAEKRYSSAGQMIAALSEAMGFGQGSVELPLPAPRRNWFRAWMLGLAAALGLVLAVPQTRQVLFRPEAPMAASARGNHLRGRELLEGYYKPKALETAIPILQAVTKEEPRYAPAWADLGRANFMQFWQLRDNKYVEPALKASLQAIALNPGLASAHVTLGMLYTETGKHDLAAQELSEALRLDSRSAEAHVALAELSYRQGRKEDVEPAFQKAADLDPGNWRVANEFGFYYIRAGRFDAAAKQYEKALALTPDNPRALNNLGICYRRLNRLDEARSAFERAIRVEPAPLPYVNLGNVLDDQGAHSEAIVCFRKAIEMDSANYKAWTALASNYRRTGAAASQTREAYEKAAELAEQLRKTRTKDPALLVELAVHYAHLGDSGKSLPLLRQAAALAPENPAVLELVARGFELLHRREDSLEWVRQAIARGRPRSIIEKDSVLSALRSDPRYRAMVRAAPITTQ